MSIRQAVQSLRTDPEVLFNRETGGRPVRTRHCEYGAGASIYVTGKPGRRMPAR